MEGIGEQIGRSVKRLRNGQILHRGVGSRLEKEDEDNKYERANGGFLWVDHQSNIWAGKRELASPRYV